MHPIVHPAVGYCCYALYTRLDRGEPPAAVPTVVAVGAAILPDALDQPLYHLGLTPVGRTIGHSLLFALPAMLIVWYVTARHGHGEWGVAFAIGYGSHIAADSPWHLLMGEYHELGFLLWPITPMPAYEGTKTLATVQGLEITTTWP